MAYGVNAPFGLRPIARIGSGTLTSQTNKYNLYVINDGEEGYGGYIFNGDPVVFTHAFPQGLARTSENTGPSISRYSPGFEGDKENVELAPDSKRPIVGVFQGCEWIDPQGKLQKSNMWTAATKIKKGTQPIAYILDDPYALFDIQVSSSSWSIKGAVFPYFNGPVENLKYALAPAMNAAIGYRSQKWVDSNAPLNPISTGDMQTGQSHYYLTPVSPYVTLADKTVQLTHDYDKRDPLLPLKVIGLTKNPENLAAFKYNPYISPGQVSSDNNTPFLNVTVMINNHVYKAGTPGITYSLQ